MPRQHLLALAIAAFLAPAAVLAQASARTTNGARALETITVTADPLALPGDELLQPTEVLAGAALDEQRAGTIGETVARLPGVQSSYFGPGVGRPIIRGLEGPRVQVLSDGIAALDVSTLSVDHAVSVDPFLADQIEVLKGPATLLYGSGAIGGVVNIVDGRIPSQPVEGIGGRVELRGGDVNNVRSGVARIDAGNGSFALHADYLKRSGDNFDAPGGGELDNTQSEVDSRAVGVAWTGDRGHLGAALSRYDNRYGIPPEQDEDDTSGSARAKGGEGEIELDMQQQRIDIDGVLRDPFAGFESLGVRIGHNDYEHAEIILDSGEVGTRFLNEAIEGRIEAVHAPLGAWRGALGVQSSRRAFEAIGDEAFVPPSVTRDTGVFVVERAEFEPFSVELGARYDSQSIDLDAGGGTDHSAYSLSAAGQWDFSDRWHATLNLDRAQRAPQAEELYSDGPHEATGSFEIGDANLVEETSNQVELGLHWHSGTIEAKVAGYYNRFDDFIYLVDTGAEEDGLPVRQWTQDNARFFGFEGEFKAQLADTAFGRFDARVFADTVRGNLRDGGDLPRIAPSRLGGSIDWSYDQWRAGLGAIGYARQDRVAELESPTSGYTLVDANLSYAFKLAASDLELFAVARNLTDRSARIHTSLLKDRAPLPGRGIAIGVRAYF